MLHIGCLDRNRKSLVLFVAVDSKDSNWLAWLYPSPYTAALRFGIVIMVLEGVFKRVDVNDNFFENGGGEVFVSLNTLLCINVASVEPCPASLFKVG
jgi:hypothetical protein